MSETRKWDMASTHSLESGAEWLLGKADALAVVVIRVNDAVLAADPGIPGGRGQVGLGADAAARPQSQPGTA